MIEGEVHSVWVGKHERK